MPIESATYISQLDPLNPTANDSAGQGDDQTRLIKSVLQASFPNISGAMTATHTVLNGLDARVTTAQGAAEAAQSDADDAAAAVTTLANGRVTSAEGAITTLQGTINTAQRNAIVDAMYPVGAVILSFINTNPGGAGWLNRGTWTQIAQGRFLAGVGQGTDSESVQKTLVAGNNAGKYEHVLTTGEMPAHGHSIEYSSNVQSTARSSTTGAFLLSDAALAPSATLTANTGTPAEGDPVGGTGGGEAHENTPPSFGVYVWQRTA